MTKSDFRIMTVKLGKGTHGTAIYLIQLQLGKKQKPQDFKDFQALIPKLKEYREQSDYEDISIDSKISYDAVNKSDSIMNILTRNF